MKNKKIDLAKGYILVYDFGDVKVHNYNTADYIDDQVVLLEKNNKLVVIEQPAFYDNVKELEEYIKSLKVELTGILLSYHMGGGTFLGNAKKYATHQTDEYGHIKGGKALIDNFRATFGASFDSHIHDIQIVSYDGYLIYLAALYDFYLIASAIVYVIKQRNNHNPIITAW